MADLVAEVGGDPVHVRVALGRLVASGRVAKRPATWVRTDEPETEE